MAKLRGLRKKIQATLLTRGLSGLLESSILRCAERVHENRWVSNPDRSLGGGGGIVLADVLRDFGVMPGDTLMVHSSWDRLRFAFESPIDVIAALLDYLGPRGTLAMPAIPLLEARDGAVFDADRTLSKAGLVSEVFRRTAGVARSISINHSVCAIGPEASYLTRDHHLGITSWDRKSPYRRLSMMPRAWVVGLGVGRKLRAATATHCVESELIAHPYFRKLFTSTIKYQYRSRSLGTGKIVQRVRHGANYGPKLARHFSQDELKEVTISGVDFYAIPAKILVEKSIKLGLQGKTMYIWPIPWPWYFWQSRPRK